MTERVLVTGATGYVALHITGQLLKKGYSVVGTVRNEGKKQTLAARFSKKLVNPKLELVVVEDIAKDGAFDELFQTHQDITTVLHTASPFSYGLNKALDAAYLKPAVNGTLNVLKSITENAPQVTNVVITSSFASVINLDKSGDKSFIHTEETWNPIEWKDVGDNEHLGYIASKKLAESAAWRFIRENDVKFQLSTITPPFILGPQFFDEDAKAEKLNTSAQIIKDLLHSDPADTRLFGDISRLQTDVRDVAAFHILAFESPTVAGSRLTPISSPFSQQSILNIINDKFPQLNGKISKGQPDGAKDLPYPSYDVSVTNKKVGGYEYIPLEKTVVDAVNQILY